MAVKPPRPVSPPLNALRAFEAAARLGSFTRAAEELCVTPGAVAQHVKQLEAWAGARLFHRRAQGVELTDASHAVAPALGDAFDQMGAAVRALHQATSPHRIQLAALPSVAQLWLSPRLPALRQAMRDLVLSVTAMEVAPNLAREPFDLAIFFSAGPDVSLGEDRIFPVCTPELAAQLERPQDLNRVPCLFDAVWADDWARWLVHADTQDVRPQGPVHSLYALALEDALQGAGVLMGHAALVEPHLQSGALVAPFSLALSLGRKLGILLPDGPISPVLQQLVDLLSGESGF